MFESRVDSQGVRFEMAEFKSISEFTTYLDKHPFNNHFKDVSRSSESPESKYEEWYMTDSFDEAQELLAKGWTEQAEKLTLKLKDKNNSVGYVSSRKPAISMVGFQPIVPLFMVGVPEDMATMKIVPRKQPVVTLVKDIAYSFSFSAKERLDESIKAIQVVQQLQANGVRCNVDVIAAGYNDSRGYACRIRVKSAGERLNISKLAYPLCHPSFHRRQVFRFIEKFDGVNLMSKSIIRNYGRVSTPSMVKGLLKKGEYYIPAKWDGKAEDVKSLDQMSSLATWAVK